MKITVKTPLSTHSLEIPVDSTVEDLKHLLSLKLPNNPNPSIQRLIHMGKLLKSGKIPLHKSSEFYLVLSTCWNGTGYSTSGTGGYVNESATGGYVNGSGASRVNGTAGYSPNKSKLVLVGNTVYLVNDEIVEPEPVVAQAAAQIPNNLNLRAFLVDALWLSCKLAFMLYIFTDRRAFYRSLFFYILAFIIFIVQLGIFPIPTIDQIIPVAVPNQDQEDQTLLGSIGNIIYTFFTSMFVAPQEQPLDAE